MPVHVYSRSLEKIRYRVNATFEISMDQVKSRAASYTCVL